MKNIPILSKLKKYFLLLFVFLSLIILTASEYTIPRAAYSVCTADLDLDGDEDIVVGHNYNVYYDWAGLSILWNDGGGTFTRIDSLYLFANQTTTLASNLDSIPIPEIIARYYDIDSEKSYLAIIYNSNYDNVLFFLLGKNLAINYIAIGDVDGDNFNDILCASNNGGFWGVLYNDGNGNFSEPVYYNVDYYPGDIACGDLNNDGKDDVVVCGLKLEIYFSNGTDFQKVLVDETDFQNEVEIADIDNDGNNDLVVSRYGAPHLPHYLQIYKNNGESEFVLTYEEEISGGIDDQVIVELNGDGYKDIIYHKNNPGDNKIFVRLNNGLGEFLVEKSYITGDEVFRVASSDIDGNGYNDIVTTHYLHAFLEGNLHVLFNDSTGNFVKDPVTNVNEKDMLPNNFVLYQNYPNPFNGTTNISFYLPSEQSITIIIYDIGGRKVVRLIEDKRLPEGRNQVEWNSKNNFGQNVSSGVYLYSLRVHNTEITKKMVVVE